MLDCSTAFFTRSDEGYEAAVSSRDDGLDADTAHSLRTNSIACTMSGGSDASNVRHSWVMG